MRHEPLTLKLYKLGEIKYGNEDNVRQKVICSKEIKIRRYKLGERGGRDYL